MNVLLRKTNLCKKKMRSGMPEKLIKNVNENIATQIEIYFIRDGAGRCLH